MGRALNRGLQESPPPLLRRWRVTIETGIWSLTLGAFIPNSDASQVNAIRVIVGRGLTGHRNAALPVYFSPFLGAASTVNVHGSAAAVGGGPRRAARFQ